MSAASKIEWTESTWNPIVGCSIVSPGCTNCYAMRMAARIEAMHGAAGTRTHYRGTTRKVKRNGVWTGKVALAPEKTLLQPLRRREPTIYFVNSMGDLFHESIPDEWIDTVFAVASQCPQHTLQILTKRSARMRAYFLRGAEESEQATARRFGSALHATGAPAPLHGLEWPMNNVWLGVSAERQQEADERIPPLLDTPAAVRFVSAEPLLGPIDLRHHLGISPNHEDLRGGLHWIIVGGESGPHARPMHPDWARSIRDQCQAAGVAFFFKQWGGWSPTGSVDIYCHGPSGKSREFPHAPGIAWLRDGRICYRDFSVAEHARRMREGRAHNSRAVEVDHQALAEFHTSAETTGDMLGYQWMYCVGKKRAGRLLDGREWNEMPEVHK